MHACLGNHVQPQQEQTFLLAIAFSVSQVSNHQILHSKSKGLPPLIKNTFVQSLCTLQLGGTRNLFIHSFIHRRTSTSTMVTLHPMTTPSILPLRRALVCVCVCERSHTHSYVISPFQAAVSPCAEWACLFEWGFAEGGGGFSPSGANLWGCHAPRSQ